MGADLDVGDSDFIEYKGAEEKSFVIESLYANLRYFYKDLRMPKDDIPSTSKERVYASASSEKWRHPTNNFFPI
jgi:hypothetical protein